jgi:hypothetical protein
MATFLDRRALKSVLGTATAIRKIDHRSVERELTVYVARPEGKPSFWAARAHDAVHAAAVEAFGGRPMQERHEGFLAVFAYPMEALRAALHAAHVFDLASDLMALPSTRIALALGRATVIDRPFRAVAGPVVDRAAKLLARAATGHVALEKDLFDYLKLPEHYADIEVLVPKRGKIPGLGIVETVALKPLGLPKELDDELELVDAELRARPRR